jgi:hypothetical protein
MCFHPAYPSQADLSREAEAAARDRADLATLTELHTILCVARARASQCDEIHHPARRWTTDCLLEALDAEISNIDGTAMLMRGCPLVLEG